ncbi:hypothetical protein GCM10009647_058950 [Streptomyces sanglieri]
MTSINAAIAAESRSGPPSTLPLPSSAAGTYAKERVEAREFVDSRTWYGPNRIGIDALALTRAGSGMIFGLRV